MSALRVLVGFKVTPDYEALRDADWSAGAANGVETRFVRRILNCFDESSLELALRLAESLAEHGTRASLAAMSVGGKQTEPFLTTLRALGYQRTARVHTEADLDFAPAVVADLIAAYARRVDRSDLVMVGCRSGPGDSGTVPFRIAERLGWPCLAQVTDVESSATGHVRVAYLSDDGLAQATLRPPCVLAVGNAVVSHLRVPTLTDRLAHRTEAIDVVSGDDLGVDITDRLRRETCALVSLETIDRTRSGAIVQGATPTERAQTLFREHLQDMIEQP